MPNFMITSMRELHTGSFLNVHINISQIDQRLPTYILDDVFMLINFRLDAI